MNRAITRTRYVPIGDDLYAIVIRHGSTAWCAGRVCRVGNQWMAHGIGARAWSNYYPTRREAVANKDNPFFALPKSRSTMLADNLTPAEIETALRTLAELYENSSDAGGYLSSVQQEIAARVLRLVTESHS
jgi:hypothetical protein